jgi:hypothetical protein
MRAWVAIVAALVQLGTGCRAPEAGTRDVATLDAADVHGAAGALVQSMLSSPDVVELSTAAIGDDRRVHVAWLGVRRSDGAQTDLAAIEQAVQIALLRSGRFRIEQPQRVVRWSRPDARELEGLAHELGVEAALFGELRTGPGAELALEIASTRDGRTLWADVQALRHSMLAPARR